MTTQPAAPPTVRRSAILSDDERYRYLLLREWDDTLPTATIVMLNPSTADALVDDATIRRLAGEKGFARRWACGAVMVVNLYGLRATDPAELWTADDPVGPDNDAHLYAAAQMAAETGGPLIGGWGAQAKPERIAEVLAIPGMDRIQALAVTNAGQPSHPLYLPGDLTPQPWSRP